LDRRLGGGRIGIDDVENRKKEKYFPHRDSNSDPSVVQHIAGDKDAGT
jgi:hypothetical protein